MSASNCNLDHLIPIHYNDQTMRLNQNHPMDIKWVRVKRNGQTTSLEKSKTKQSFSDLPKAHFEPIKKDLVKGKAFKMTNTYRQYTDSEEESRRDEVEYDLDREDLEWLKLINARREQVGRAPIAESYLEKAIDLLEKESHFQFTQPGQSSSHAGLQFLDNNAPCCICNDSEDSNANQIIFCDMCNIAVHQECYGVPYIPEGQWFCRRCHFSPSVSVHCALCPFTTGAFKQTADGRWVHVICTNWLNEVYFANTIFLEPVEGVDFSLKRRHKLTCIICRNKMGACVKCSHRACPRAFHVMCAFYVGMKMEVKESRPKKNNNPEAIVINRFAYCHLHMHIQLLYGPKSDESKTRQREIKEKMRELRRQLNTNQTNSCLPVPVIPHEKTVEIMQQLQDYFADIHKFWSQKRLSRFGVPLIRRLQVYLEQQKPFTCRHSLDDMAPIPFGQHQEQPCTSRVASARSQGKRHQRHQPISGNQDQDTIIRLTNLRRDFERIRLLCELTMKREKLKREAVDAEEQMLAKIKPISVILRETLDKLVDKDHEKVFTQPVNESDAPGYSAIISQPMDLQKMRRRLEKGRYQRVDDVRTDFMLMMYNCVTYNRDNSRIFNYGHRITRIGLNVLNGAEVEETNLGQHLQLMRQAIDQMGIPVPGAPPAHILQMKFDKINDGTAVVAPPSVPSSSSSSNADAADGFSNVENEAEDEEKQQKATKKQQSKTRRFGKRKYSQL